MNSSENQRSEKLERSIQDLLSGDISDTERQELLEILDTDAEARAIYIDQTRINGLMEWRLSNPQSDNLLHQETPPSKKYTSPIILTAILGFSAAALIILTLFLNQQNNPAPLPSTNSNSKPFLTTFKSNPDQRPLVCITHMDAPENALKVGQWLSAGTLTLESGIMVLCYPSGSQLTLHGPSQFVIGSGQRGELKYGIASLSSDSYAYPFNLNTPLGELSINDAHAGLRITQQGLQEIHSLRGNINLTKKITQQTRTIRQGRAIAFQDNHPTKPSPSDALFSQSPSDHPSRALPYHHWSCDQITNGRLAGAGSELTSIAEVQDWSQVKKAPMQLVLKQQKKSEDAVIVESTQPQPLSAEVIMKRTFSKMVPPVQQTQDWIVPGVFGQAIHFPRNETFVSTRVTGIAGHQARTVAFWIKFPKPEAARCLRSIISWGSLKAGGKWQIRINHNADDGPLGAIRTACSYGFRIGSTDLRDGKWHHVVSVMIGGENADAATHIHHYVDGVLEKEGGAMSHRINTKVDPIRYFPVMFGLNLNTYSQRDVNIKDFFIERQTSGRRIETLRSCLDEIYIFQGALLPYEIQELKNNNKPPTQYTK